MVREPFQVPLFFLAFFCCHSRVSLCRPLLLWRSVVVLERKCALLLVCVLPPLFPLFVFVIRRCFFVRFLLSRKKKKAKAKEKGSANNKTKNNKNNKNNKTRTRREPQRTTRPQRTRERGDEWTASRVVVQGGQEAWLQGLVEPVQDVPRVGGLVGGSVAQEGDLLRGAAHCHVELA